MLKEMVLEKNSNNVTLIKNEIDKEVKLKMIVNILISLILNKFIKKYDLWDI